MGVGARRFASNQEVGRTWMSATEQITASTDKTKQKWVSFAVGVAPAPLLAILVPGTFSFKAIIAAAAGVMFGVAFFLAAASFSSPTPSERE